MTTETTDTATTAETAGIGYAPVEGHGQAGAPRIQVGTGPDTIRTLRTELTSGLLPIRRHRRCRRVWSCPALRMPMVRGDLGRDFV